MAQAQRLLAPASKVRCDESLTELILSRAQISELPKSIGDLKNLKILNIAYCRKLSSLPSTINKLVKLEVLIASFCQNLGGEVPKDGLLSSLPSTINKLVKLEVLIASFCQNLGGEVPKDGLSSLKVLRLSYTCISGFPDATVKLSCLEEFDLKDRSMIQSLPKLPTSLTDLVITCHLHTLHQPSHLIHLKQLRFHDCKLLESMPELPSGILKLYVSGCYKLKELPSLSSLELLSILGIEACQELTEIKGLEGLKSLKELYVIGCNKLSNPDGLEHLQSLRCLGMVGIDLSTRRKLFEHLHLDGPTVNDDLFQGLDRLRNLEELTIYSCQSLIRLDLLQLTHLKLLMISNCHNLIEIKGLERLKNLERLDIKGIKSIETLPDLPCFDKVEFLCVGKCWKLRDVQVLEKVKFMYRSSNEGFN